MIIVADSGSTKTSWVLLDDQRKMEFSTEGYNPYYVSAEYVQQSIRKHFPLVEEWDLVTAVYFYGAGCAGGKEVIITDALSLLFPNAAITVDSDLLAAAKSVLGDEDGFISILGTGTNTGVYQGGKIVNQVSSLGFLLGDEGSGAYLGKKLLSRFARKALPKELQTAFEDRYQLSASAVVPTFYDQQLQNRYSASFTPFLQQHIDHPYIDALVKSAFNDFFENIVCLYPDYQLHALNSIGSIGFTFASQLEAVAEAHGMEVGKIHRSPMQGLVAYYQSHLLQKTDDI